MSRLQPAMTSLVSDLVHGSCFSLSSAVSFLVMASMW